MGRKNESAVGDRELDLLRWVADAGSATVGEATAGFGESRGLARTTVQTMLERLKDKGRLSRRRVGGVYRYAAGESAGEVLRGAVARFIEDRLDGSVSPFVSYLSERHRFTAEELDELETLVHQLKRRGES